MEGRPEGSLPGTPAGWIEVYAGTVLVFPSAGGTIDLRRPLDATTLALLSDRGLLCEFFVITAHNPLGGIASKAANDRAAAALEAELRTMAVPFEQVQGCSIDLTHCEASVAALLDRDAAIRIARSHRQNALFRFDGARFWLIGALLDFEPVALPLDIRSALPQPS